ncbi:MAG: prepilin-type N-terminal cleavage/methylation domain-containing protein [Caldimicrobium sp.]|jgi:prepilin-type N-terminal cleavage/methylation domain-containing protein
MRERVRGFTLVELAIVLVIIGIILGAVLKGQELIFNAKVKRLVSQAKEMMAALYTYYDKYGYYPGDDPTAATRWAGTISGNGNGLIDGWYCSGDANSESCRVWQHLRLANIISGDPNDTNPASMVPKHVFGGAIHLFSANATVAGSPRSGYWLAFVNLPGKAAEALDRAIDDGKCNSGSVVAYNGDCGTGGSYQENLYYEVWINF